MQRQFTSGSRQAPDPFDQFLEANNFYRKHTARDASCLFRVISEQMYDTQRHHLEIRKKCVQYMRKHLEIYEPLIDGDLYEYFLDLSKPKTFGTLVELQAVGHMFKRNILLFQPYNLGSYLNKSNNFKEVFRVFYTPERHFDSVFTADYIKDAAICQSICYDILYKEIFRLPDVSYAVEKMLHSTPTVIENNEVYYDTNEDGYCTRIYYEDGRFFDLDLPDATNCILENYEWCHFHCDRFPRISNEVQDELDHYGSGSKCNKDANYMLTLNKTVDAFLPDKYTSCVRQLLNEGITPFPYKVAKALDPNMYRNIEFDAWNEGRKESKYINWYNGDTNFKVGAKCHVRLHKSEKELYICHIQEISADKGYCMVFVERLGEKRLVPYDALSPLPPEEFKPWSLPYSLQRKVLRSKSVKCSSSQLYYQLRLKNNYGDNLKHVGKQSIYMPQYSYKYDNVGRSNSSTYYTLQQLVHLDHFQGQNMQYCTMPLTLTHDNPGRNAHSPNELDVNNNNMPRPALAPIANTPTSGTNMPVQPTVHQNERSESADYAHEVTEVPNIPVPQYPCIYTDELNYCYGYTNRGTVYYLNNQQVPTYAPNIYMSYGGAMPNAESNMYMPTVARMPESELNMPPVHFEYGAHGEAETPALRDLRLGNTSNTGVLVRTAPSLINWDASPSLETYGEDLPTDSATLRYFYNLGVEYHRQMTAKNNKNNSDQEEKHMKELTNEMRELKFEENTTKSEPDSNNNSSNISNNNALSAPIPLHNSNNNNNRNMCTKNNNNTDVGASTGASAGASSVVSYASHNNMSAGANRGAYQGRRSNSRYYYNRERHQPRAVIGEVNSGRNGPMHNFSHYRGGPVSNGSNGSGSGNGGAAGGGVTHDNKPNYKNPFHQYRRHGSGNFGNSNQQTQHNNYAPHHQRPPPAIMPPPSSVVHGESSPVSDTQVPEGGSAYSQNLSSDSSNNQVSNNFTQPPPPLGVTGSSLTGYPDVSPYPAPEFVSQPITLPGGNNGGFCIPLSPYNQSPYGIYSVPPPTPGYMPATPFMAPPPQPAAYANGLPYVNNEYIEQPHESVGPIPLYSYPTAMPFYYSQPPTALPSGPHPSVAPPTTNSQNYWCVPPPPPSVHVGNTLIPTLPAQMQTLSVTSSIANTTRSQTPTITYTSPIGNTFSRTLTPLAQNMLSNAKYTDTGNKTARREKNA